jgi:hypothetical protein
VTLRAKVLTVSDGVAAGSRDDKSGTALVARLEDAGYEVAPAGERDGRDPVAPSNDEAGFAGLIVTTGGTGFGPRDLTPEERAVIEREAPGLAEAMRQVSDRDERAFGMLSRGRAARPGRRSSATSRGPRAGGRVPRSRPSRCPMRSSCSRASIPIDNGPLNAELKHVILSSSYS